MHTHSHTHIHAYQLSQHLERIDVKPCTPWCFRSLSHQSSFRRHEQHLLALQDTEIFLSHVLPQVEHESEHTMHIDTQ